MHKRARIVATSARQPRGQEDGNEDDDAPGPRRGLADTVSSARLRACACTPMEVRGCARCCSSVLLEFSEVSKKGSLHVLPQDASRQLMLLALDWRSPVDPLDRVGVAHKHIWWLWLQERHVSGGELLERTLMETEGLEWLRLRQFPDISITEPARLLVTRSDVGAEGSACAGRKVAYLASRKIS